MYADCTWCSDDAGRGDKFSYWQRSVEEAVFELDISLESSDGFWGSIEQRSIGEIGFSRIELSTQQTISRTRSAISRSNKLQFELATVLNGSARLLQCGTEIDLSAGDFVLIDNREPYRFSTQAGSRGLSFHIPTSLLGLWLPHPEHHLSKPLRAATPWGAAVGATALAVSNVDATLSQSVRTRYAERFVSLVALALEDQGRGLSSVPPPLFQRALQTLQTLCHHTELDAAALASALGISVRYLHKIFAANGTTYRTELMAMRLDLAKALLSTPEFSSVPIAEIAWRAGFVEPSTFFRNYLQRFGVRPGQARPTSGTPAL